MQSITRSILFLLLATSKLQWHLAARAQSCSSNGKWSLDYEFGDGTDSDLETPKVLETVNEYIFESNFTISIVVCDDENYYYADDEETEEYVYELEDDFLWGLRFNLYDNLQEDIADCRDCTTHATIEEFRSCMSIVRDNMEFAVNHQWRGQIQDHLEEIKAERETCLETRPPPTTDLPTTLLFD